MKPVIFVGDTPSKDNIDPNVAFLGTKSYSVLKQWIKALNIEEYAMVNSDHFTFHQLMFTAVKNQYPIIALGKVATKAVQNSVLHERYLYSLPHPSPKNRLLNDKEFVKKELEKCKKWLTNT